MKFERTHPWPTLRFLSSSFTVSLVRIDKSSPWIYVSRLRKTTVCRCLVYKLDLYRRWSTLPLNRIPQIIILPDSSKSRSRSKIRKSFSLLESDKSHCWICGINHGPGSNSSSRIELKFGRTFGTSTDQVSRQFREAQRVLFLSSSFTPREFSGRSIFYWSIFHW